VSSMNAKLEQQIKVSKEATTLREKAKKVMGEKFAAAVSQSSGLETNVEEVKELLLKKNKELQKLQIHLASLKNNLEKEKKSVDNLGGRIKKAETMLKLNEKKLSEFRENEKAKLKTVEVNKGISFEKVKALEKEVETLTFKKASVKTQLKGKLNALSVAHKAAEELNDKIGALNSSKIELEKKIAEMDVLADNSKEKIAEKKMAIETIKIRAAELVTINQRLNDDISIQKSELESKITAMEKHTKSQKHTYRSKLVLMNQSYEKKRREHEEMLQNLNVRVNAEQTRRKLAEANVETLEKLIKIEKRALFAARADIYILKAKGKTTEMNPRKEVAHQAEINANPEAMEKKSEIIKGMTAIQSDINQTKSSRSSLLIDGEQVGSPSTFINKSNQIQLQTSG